MIMAESTDPGGEEATVEAPARQREHSPMLHLDLLNFECSEAEGSRYVLTSPRSLDACARCMVKPVELLSRSIADLVREAPGRSMQVAKGLFEVYELERQRKLKMCREERERIIRQEKRILPLMTSSSLVSPSSSKAPSRAEPCTSTTTQSHDFPKSVGQNNEPPTTNQTQRNPPLSKGSQKTNQPPFKGPHKHRSKVSKSLQRNEQSVCNDLQNRESTVSKKPTYSVPRKTKSQSLDSLQKARDGASAKPSSDSTISSCSGDGRNRAVHFIQKSRTLDTVNSLMGRSFSLGDLSHSPQTNKKVEKMVKEVKKRGVQELPQRDKKIAAIMIAKHEEESIRKEQRYWAHLQWDMQRKNSELRKEQEERERQKVLLHGQKFWESEMKRQNRNSVGEMSMDSLTKSKSPLPKEKRKSQTQESEKVKGEKLVSTQTEVKQEKSKEEKKQKEEGLFQDKLLAAKHQKKENEEQMRISKSLQNKVEKMKHQVLLQELTQKKESENEELRKTLQQNLQRAQENVEQLLEKRNLELKDRSRREELQILRAKQAAEKQEQERQEHVQELARLAEKRLQHAAQAAEEVVQHKARKAIECRLEKEKIQRENRLRVQKNEDMKRKELLESIEKKLERSDQIFRERQTVLDNARSVARASFNIREKVRAETNTRTFDKMVLEAELYANIDKK